MRRNWVSAAAVTTLTIGLSIAGVIAATSAEEGRPGPVLPPPSLFDEPRTDQPRMDQPSTQVRVVDSPSGVPASAVVTAKPAPASVKAEATLPGPDALDAPPAKKVVWWKPWTWFSNRAQPVMAPSEPVAAESVAEPAKSSDGYAFDSPSKIIRSGMGTCLKTGMWESSGAAADCGRVVADRQQPATEAAVPKTDPAPEMAAHKPAPAQSTAQSVPPRPAVEANPVVVSALAPEREIQHKPLSESDQFESMRMEAEARPDAAVDTSPKKTEDSAAAQTAGKTGKQSDAKSNATAAPKKDMKGKASHKVAQGVDKPLSMSAEALFGFKSSKLLYGGKQQLDSVAEKLSDGDYQGIRVVGHTDRIGVPARNKKLSIRRAKAVKEYLVVKGVEPDRIVIDGRGADEPITEPRQCEGLSTTARRACMAPDRRVEIVVTRAFAKKSSDMHAGR